MEALYARCCGIDVHKKLIVATLRREREKETRQFGTFTCHLRELASWLKANECECVAMESTGSFWKPLYNIFELEGIKAIIVNARHMRAVPGRKTDVKDSEWIADLLQHGLLKASFVPDREQRELRELTRYRKSRIEERARDINRLQKILEGANIKVSGVLSDITGASAQRFLALITSDEQVTLQAISSRREPNMKASAEELLASLEGIVSPLQKELLNEVLRVIREQTVNIERIDAMIERYLTDQYRQAVKAIDALPGIAPVSAQQIIAEIGPDMSRFPSADHLCSWGGICPGNNESAGKRKSGRTNKANVILKSTLVQCALVAAKNKESFFHAQYQRLVVRRGAKKAVVAVAHSMLIAIYHVLKGAPFQDLGAGYYAQFNTERKIQSHLKQLKALGWEPPVSATA